jgi:drug/metabolite transporter (DMT)-like permease
MKPASASPTMAVALTEALLTTIIWGSSFVVAKIGLRTIGPLTLAGLRYFLAFVLLSPFLLVRLRRNGWPDRGTLRQLALLGITAYLLGNGALFIALQFVPATLVAFMMSLGPILILIGSLVWLKETPTRLQELGLLVSLGGMALFFIPGLQAAAVRGLAILALGTLAFAAFGLMGRAMARDRRVDSLTLTAVPLAIGGGALLLVGWALEGWPQVTLEGAGIVGWLAVVNTAVAYLIYNHALQRLTALQMNLILNLSPFVTAGLAFLLLGERLTLLQGIGLLVATLGVAVAQRPSRAGAPAPIAGP